MLQKGVFTCRLVPRVRGGIASIASICPRRRIAVANPVPHTGRYRAASLVYYSSQAATRRVGQGNGQRAASRSSHGTQNGAVSSIAAATHGKATQKSCSPMGRLLWNCAIGVARLMGCGERTGVFPWRGRACKVARYARQNWLAHARTPNCLAARVPAHRRINRWSFKDEKCRTER
jgi:hypothetical protein